MAGLLKDSSKEVAKELSKPKVTRSPIRTRRITPPHRFTYCKELSASRRNIVLLYAKLGLHQHNFLRGKDLQLSSITQFTKTVHSAASSYNITLIAKDPETSGSLQTFKARVSETSYNEFRLSCTSSYGPPVGKTTSNVLGDEFLGDFMPELPLENPFQDGTHRFHVLKKSEVLKNDWIHLYLELAVATTNRHHIRHVVLHNLKILKVAMEITRDLEPFTKGLGAYDATFYIRYKDLCKDRVGDDVDRVAIFRRIVDMRSGFFRLVGRTESLQTITPSNGKVASSPSAQD